MTHPHSDPKELLRRLDRAAELVQIGGHYQHLNGDLYQVDSIVMREADLVIAVVYRAVAGPPISWSRPIDEFLERFQRVGFPIPSPPG